MKNKVTIEFKYSRPVTQVVDLKVDVDAEGLMEWCIENNEDPADMSIWVDAYLNSLEIGVEDGTAVTTVVTLQVPDTDRYSKQRPWVRRAPLAAQPAFYVSYVFDGDELAPHRRITDIGHSHEDIHDAVTKP
jgi:hypothetical protein